MAAYSACAPPGSPGPPPLRPPGPPWVRPWASPWTLALLFILPLAMAAPETNSNEQGGCRGAARRLIAGSAANFYRFSSIVSRGAAEELVYQANCYIKVVAVTKRGISGKFGDRCDTNTDCRFEGSMCDPKAKTCRCVPDLPATNHIDKCGKPAAVNESCFFNDQCEQHLLATECRDGRCVCRFERSPVFNAYGTVECIAIQEPEPPLPPVDPTMIGVLVGMGLMFITLCVVMRLFSQARWRDNRTIFNTPNPRLMNASLLKQDKHKEERRGSRGSVRGPSRQPSMASLRPHSPGANGSRHGSRPESAGSSNASATSTKSLKSPTLLNAGGVQSPILESVTVEVQDQEEDEDPRA